MIVEKETHAARLLRPSVAVDVGLVCLETECLLQVDLMLFSIALHGHHAVCHHQVLSCFLSVAAAHIRSARFDVDAVDFHKPRVLIRKARPHSVLPLQLFRRNQILRCHKITIHQRRCNQLLKFNPQAARNLPEHAKRRVRRSLFDLREHTLADPGLL